jgi:UDP-galactose transporter B1
LTMVAGNLFIYELQSRYGSLNVTTTTTLRKLASILLSVVYFGHAMAPLQWAGVVVVVLAEPMGKLIFPKAEEKKTDDKKKTK